jgi:hypothetical protein
MYTDNRKKQMCPKPMAQRAIVPKVYQQPPKNKGKPKKTKVK